MRTKGHRQAHLSKTLTAFSSAEYGSRPPGVLEYHERKKSIYVPDRQEDLWVHVEQGQEGKEARGEGGVPDQGQGVPGLHFNFSHSIVVHKLNGEQWELFYPETIIF